MCPGFHCIRYKCDSWVYKYNHKEEELEYIWTIPDRETCHIFVDNAMLIHPDEKDLLKMIMDFRDGTLWKLCKKLNGEKADRIELDKG